MITAYANAMPEFHHVAVPAAHAIGVTTVLVVHSESQRRTGRRSAATALDRS